LLSGNKNQKGGVSLKVVKDTIAEQWGFGLIPKPATILWPDPVPIILLC
jgi:hypothetical protein